MINNTLSESDLDSISPKKKAEIENLISFILGNKGQTLKSLRKELGRWSPTWSEDIGLICQSFDELLDIWKPYGSFDKFPQLTDLTFSTVQGLKLLMEQVIRRDEGNPRTPKWYDWSEPSSTVCDNLQEDFWYTPICSALSQMLNLFDKRPTT